MGDFNNAGQTWSLEPTAVNVHDYPHDAWQVFRIEAQLHLAERQRVITRAGPAPPGPCTSGRRA